MCCLQWKQRLGVMNIEMSQSSPPAFRSPTTRIKNVILSKRSVAKCRYRVIAVFCSCVGVFFMRKCWVSRKIMSDIHVFWIIASSKGSTLSFYSLICFSCSHVALSKPCDGVFICFNAISIGTLVTTLAVLSRTPTIVTNHLAAFVTPNEEFLSKKNSAYRAIRLHMRKNFTRHVGGSMSFPLNISPIIRVSLIMVQIYAA